MEKKKLFVLTGFLGAGKTSFLQHILEAFSDKKLAVIQNEFGKIGIDGSILQKQGIPIKEINRGSIFCSCLQLSFVEALAELAKSDMESLFGKLRTCGSVQYHGDFREREAFGRGCV